MLLKILLILILSCSSLCKIDTADKLTNVVPIFNHDDDNMGPTFVDGKKSVAPESILKEDTVLISPKKPSINSGNDDLKNSKTIKTVNNKTNKLIDTITVESDSKKVARDKSHKIENGNKKLKENIKNDKPESKKLAENKKDEIESENKKLAENIKNQKIKGENKKLAENKNDEIESENKKFINLKDNVTIDHKNLSICKTCQCLDVNPFYVDCADMKLTEVPASINVSITTDWRLKLEGNSITRINKFPTLSRLSALSFRFNEISEVSKSAFEKLTNLTNLDLSHNKLISQSLDPEIFKGPYKENVQDPIPLKQLKLDYNLITSIHHTFFKHVPYLTELSLSGNPLGDLNDDTAQALSSLRSLERLDFSFVGLSDFPPRFFNKLVHLKDLNLSGNKFKAIPHQIAYAGALKYLIFDHNDQLQTINSKEFSKAKDLKVSVERISISYSANLMSIENDSFVNFKSLKDFCAHDNPKLNFISDDAFRGLSLEKVNLKRNRLETMSASHWENISHLDLQGNPWICDCHTEWLAKEIALKLAEQFTADLKCEKPKSIRGFKMISKEVQNSKFSCRENSNKAVTIIIIIIGFILMSIGTLFCVFEMFRRKKNDTLWSGSSVRYRRTVDNELYY